MRTALPSFMPDQANIRLRAAGYINELEWEAGEMPIEVKDSRVENMVNPLGIDSLQPRFSWKLDSGESGQKQTAYRVLAASSRERLERETGDMWDSGKVESEQSVHVEYQGKRLESGQVCYWMVMVWDKAGNASGWSGEAYFSMGLLEREQWKGRWIGERRTGERHLMPCPYFRKSFSLNKPVRRAMLYATAFGLYETHLNGRRVGEQYFAPGWTDYHTRVHYQTYDVTRLLGEGDNAIGVVLGSGWYCGQVGMMNRNTYGVSPSFLLQLNVEYEDGTCGSVVSDESWTMNSGPIEYACFLEGERYDARLEWDGWALPGFNDGGWRKADLFEPYEGKLEAMPEPPVTVTEKMMPADIRRTGRGTYIVDMGQNMVGWLRIRAEGPAGSEITIVHAEMLNPDGTLYTDNLRLAAQRDIYVLKGEEENWFEPHFTFHGFRYAEIAGYPGELKAESIIGCVVHSATPRTGRFETSDPMINRLYGNIVWGQRGNFLSVPTDCPQRDERLGWTGDAQIFIRTASYNMDVSNFFVKYMKDIADAQQPSGAFPDVAPDAGWVEFKKRDHLKWMAPDNAGWGDAGVIIPWTVYLMYGDQRILETHYEAMKKWVDYLLATSKGLLRPDHANYGDWLSINADTPKDVLATAYFAYSALLFSRISGIVGHTENEAIYADLFERIKQAFVQGYLDRQSGIIKGDTQTVYVLALYFRLLPDEWAPVAARRLEALIQSNGNRLSTGFLGVGYLLPALSENGLNDLAYTLLHQDTFPSWLYSVKHGATTIWERWDGWTEERGFQDAGMNSFNHYSLGSVGEWLFRYAAGIDADPRQPGFKHTLIRPRTGGRLTFVRAEFESAYGTWESRWEIRNGVVELTVRVPVNTTATVYVPSGKAEVPAEAVELVREGNDRRFLLGSGCYSFRYEWI
ncbi:family 78 glycoside hydrolase catalytic domain [Paenibacillus tarimensis]